jgi:hypothetical protein
MHISVCVAFPQVINWQIPVHCWFCNHPCPKSCDLYIKEQGYEDSHEKTEQEEILCQTLLTISAFELILEPYNCAFTCLWHISIEVYEI